MGGGAVGVGVRVRGCMWFRALGADVAGAVCAGRLSFRVACPLLHSDASGLGLTHHIKRV
ncbi:hypothetical protein TorRG33x02_081450 [Trema orientale]|uniref:Uncharacterized protein n=1 Tax=Trema orientale TaxID=63057 RepID=A0A2P5FEJ4_TREOI|nr:hypothetical protein TorRG33x02_081450 [Trema orientale]